jgi:hypothetical protein
MFKNIMSLPNMVGAGVEGAVLSHPASWVPYGIASSLLGVGSTRPVQKLLTGGYGPQQYVSNLLESMRPVSKGYLTGSSFNRDNRKE